jgi:hypothetical protein
MMKQGAAHSIREARWSHEADGGYLATARQRQKISLLIASAGRNVKNGDLPGMGTAISGRAPCKAHPARVRLSRTNATFLKNRDRG